MKKNVLSKIMAVLVIVSCAFIFAACGSIQKPDVNITSFVVDTSSIPEVIVVGEFDEAGIKATVNYSDGTNEPIIITTEMIPEEYRELLNTPGIYKIELMFRNQKAELEVRMVNSTNIYQVNFYNHKDQIISTQFVYDGEDATLPSEFMTNMEGYAFVAWDRSHEDISEDTNIYGLYVNVENTLTDAKMEEALLKAEQYYITHDHFTTINEESNHGEETNTYKAMVNYHYDSENGVATSQSSSISSRYGKTINVWGEEGYETLYINSVDSEYDRRTYEQLKADEYGELITDEEFNQMILNVKLYGDEIEMGSVSQLFNAEFGHSRTVDFDYEITSNKLIYTCTVTFTDNHGTDTEIDSYTVKYDDEKVLQIICNYSNEGSHSSINTVINIDYTTLEFEELITDDMRVLCDLDVAMRNMIKDDFTLTASYAEVNDVVEFDADNKILKSSDGNYMYASNPYNGFYYEGDLSGLEKIVIHNWDAEILSLVFGYSFNMVVGDVYEVEVSVDEDGNNVVSMFDKQEPGASVSWTFNNADGLIGYTVSGIEIKIDKKTEVTLTVPDEIKALEDSAKDVTWN